MLRQETTVRLLTGHLLTAGLVMEQGLNDTFILAQEPRAATHLEDA